MLWLISFGLLIACAALYQRLRQAEERLENLENSHVDMTARFLALASKDDRATEAEPRADVAQPEFVEPEAEE